MSVCSSQRKPPIRLSPAPNDKHCGLVRQSAAQPAMSSAKSCSKPPVLDVPLSTPQLAAEGGLGFAVAVD